MAKEKQIAAAQENADAQLVAAAAAEIVTVPSLDNLFSEDAGGGMEGVGANDYALPFITILQKGSPQVSRANAKCIKDAVAGMIMNTVSSNTYDGDAGIPFIPCGFQKKLVHWMSRDSGGGFLGHVAPNDPLVATAKQNERLQLQLPDGTLLVDTAYHFGLLLHEDGFPEFGIVSMYSTGLKVSRNWNTMMRAIMMKVNGKVFNPPTYSHIYRLTTVGMQKDNYDWFQWKIVSEGQVVDASLYTMAKKFSAEVAQGAVRISKPAEEFGGTSEPTGEDVPF